MPAIIKLSCTLCGGKIPCGRIPPFCSKKCELEQDKIEEIKQLEYLKDGINAIGYREFAERKGPYKKVVIIGDTHFPWASKNALQKILRFISSYRPHFIIQIGDLYDFFSASRFPRTYNLITPSEEVLQGRMCAEQMWAQIHKLAPQSKLIQIKGNHDDRPYKRLLEKAPELEPFFKIDPLFEFPQVETIHDSSQELVIDGVCYQHGFRKSGDHMKHNLMNTVHGHTHRAGVHYMMLHGRLVWELDVGMVGDLKAKPLQYSPQRWSQCTVGVGMIDPWGPRFIHESDL